ASGASRRRRVAAQVAPGGQVIEHRLGGVLLPSVGHVLGGFVAALVSRRIGERLALVAGPRDWTRIAGDSHGAVAVVAGSDARRTSGGRRVAAQVGPGGHAREYRLRRVDELDVLGARSFIAGGVSARPRPVKILARAPAGAGVDVADRAARSAAGRAASACR